MTNPYRATYRSRKTNDLYKLERRRKIDRTIPPPRWNITHLSFKQLLDRFNTNIKDSLSLIRQKSEAGLTKNQFNSIKFNYLFRTKTTISSILKVKSSYIRHHIIDQKSINLLQMIIGDELGNSDKGVKSHQQMMLDSFNIHSKEIFNIDSIDINDVEKSSLILFFAHEYRRKQELAYGSNNHCTVIGAFTAQETVADEMLNFLYSTIFEPQFKEYSSTQLINQAKIYFDCHVNGLELEHEKRALECARRAVITIKDSRDFLLGVSTYLDGQCQFWQGMAQLLMNDRQDF